MRAHPPSGSRPEPSSRQLPPRRPQWRRQVKPSSHLITPSRVWQLFTWQTGSGGAGLDDDRAGAQVPAAVQRQPGSKPRPAALPEHPIFSSRTRRTLKSWASISTGAASPECGPTRRLAEATMRGPGQPQSFLAQLHSLFSIWPPTDRDRIKASPRNGWLGRPCSVSLSRPTVCPCVQHVTPTHYRVEQERVSGGWGDKQEGLQEELHENSAFPMEDAEIAPTRPQGGLCAPQAQSYVGRVHCESVSCI